MLRDPKLSRADLAAHLTLLEIERGLALTSTTPPDMDDLADEVDATRAERLPSRVRPSPKDGGLGSLLE